MLAAGGDPHRELSLSDRAVASLAGDLAGEGLRTNLARALKVLEGEAAGLSRVGAALERLLADPDLACRWLALVLLADELSGADPSDE